MLTSTAGTNVGGDGKNTEQAGTGGNTDPITGGTGTDQGAGTGTPPVVVPLTPEQQAVVQVQHDAIAAKIRAEEKSKYEKQKLEEQAEATRKAAEAQGQFQVLYETERARADALKVTAEAATRYSSRINTMITNEIKDWPVELTATDPGEADAEVRMAWVERSRALATRLTALTKAPTGEFGANRSNPGSGGEQNKDAVTAYLDKTYQVPGKTKT